MALSEGTFITALPTQWNLGGSPLFISTGPPNFSRVNSRCASSFHPGGVNAGFADGSVHFIKNSISSWAVVNKYGDPSSSYFTITYSSDYTQTYYNLTSQAKIGVWQAVSTRANGEIISSDSY